MPAVLATYRAAMHNSPFARADNPRLLQVASEVELVILGMKKCIHSEPVMGTSWKK